MSWPLLHHLFGWHYVHLQNSCAQIVRRVHYTKSGTPYVIYFGDHYIYLTDLGPWKMTLLTGEVAA